MEFLRENILKIFIFIVILIAGILIFSLIFKNTKNTKVVTYSDVEEKLVTASKKYASDNSKLIPKKEDESNKINLDTLVNSGYISEISAMEDSNVKCTGYTQILYKNKKVLYIPYLKCGKYYETKTMADYILSNQEIVTTGDGLYKQGDSYVFRGERPNNYIGVGTRLYRIIDINEDGELRLVSYRKFEDVYVWDDRYNTEKDESTGINDYSKSRLKESFDFMIKNNTYEEGDDYNYFSEKEIEKIIPHNFCTGKRPVTDASINRNTDCQTQESNQYIGLINLSDYARASIDKNCNDIYDKSCVNYNYFANIAGVFRTLNAPTDNTYQVYYIDNGVADLTRASTTFYTNLVVYINELSLYASGDGTYENPYIVR